jgi:hypothetical protein
MLGMLAQISSRVRFGDVKKNYRHERALGIDRAISTDKVELLDCG